MPVPLFVLGKQRSGTTWLANQLCEHSQIAGVQHDYHGGVHESAYFSHVRGRYGDLKRKNNYIEFVEILAASDIALHHLVATLLRSYHQLTCVLNSLLLSGSVASQMIPAIPCVFWE